MGRAIALTLVSVGMSLIVGAGIVIPTVKKFAFTPEPDVSMQPYIPEEPPAPSPEPSPTYPDRGDTHDYSEDIDGPTPPDHLAEEGE